MYIRVVKKQRSKESKVFYQYTLAQTSRINTEVKQRNILYLGSDSLLADKENRNIVLRILMSKIFEQPELFPLDASDDLLSLALSYYDKYCLKYDQNIDNPTTIPPAKAQADYQNVDLQGLEVEDVKEFGAEHLCRQTLDKLELRDYLLSLGLDAEQVTQSLIAISARAYAASEHKTSQILNLNSELPACYGYDKPISHKQLYQVSDLLYTHKQRIDSYLYQKITDMFHLKDSLVIFDISNTYFETNKSQSKKATWGNSKEKRVDCPIVVFTGVINQDGFIRHSRIYEGNKPDSATLSTMIEDLKAHSPKQVQQTIVIDAGIAKDENLALMDKEGYRYVCVSHKRLKDYVLDQSTPQVIQLTDRDRQKVALQIFHPEGYRDTWMYVESDGKKKKEQSMKDKLCEKYEQDLEQIKSAFSKKGGTKNISKVWERIGRVKERNNRVTARYKIEVSEKDGIAVDMTWTFIPNKVKDEKSNGVYFIRTNLPDTNEQQLWDIYNTIREVESTFRSLKSDLNIRPVYHQNDGRIDAHLYLTMLAYQLVNTIRYMLKQSDINHDWKNIVRIMSTQKIQNIKVPTDKKTIYIRKPSKPIEQVQQIYKATNSNETQKTQRKYVVYH